METKITIFSFIAALIVFITREIASHADKNGDIFIMTPKQIYNKCRDCIKYINDNYKKFIKK